MDRWRFLRLGTALVLVAGWGALPTVVLQAQSHQDGSGQSRAAIATAADGFDLWYEAWGDGPAIIFVCRTPDEHRSYAEALSHFYRVVLYEPRTMAVADSQRPAGHTEGRNLDWDPAGYTKYPIELAVSDLHTVADAAGIDEFVLAGYSATAAYSAFLAPYSDRAVGLIVGGFSILGPQDYWVGVLEGARMQAIAQGEGKAAAGANLTALFYRDLHERDQQDAYSRLPGPKIVWFGSQDGEPGDEVIAMGLSLARIAQRTRLHRAEYERLGFQFIEVEGYSHIGGYLAVDVVAPRLKKALRDAGHE